MADIAPLPFEAGQKELNREALDTNTILSSQIWAELRTFLAVAKTRSFNRAADLIGSSQPTVSRQMKRLQEVLGTQLFVRSSSNAIRLTPRAEDLARSLSALDQQLFALTSDLKGEDRAAKGLVRISLTEGLNSFFIAPLLDLFSDAFPLVSVHLRQPQNLLSLRENQTDMMIGFAPESGSDLVSHPLGVMHFIPVVGRSYVERQGLPTKGDLASHRFLDSEYYAARTGLWVPWRAAVEQGQVAHICDNSFAYSMLLKAGHGIGLLGSFTLADPGAIPVQLGFQIDVPLYLTALRERLKNRPIRLFFDWVSDVLGPANPWLAKELIIPDRPSKFDAGFRRLFNLHPFPERGRASD